MKFSTTRKLFCLILFTCLISFLNCGSMKSSMYGGAGGKSYARRDSSKTSGYKKKSLKEKKEINKYGDTKDKDTSPGSSERMVVYVAKYLIHVKGIKHSVEQVNGIVSRYSGFIESVVTSDSYKQARMIIRVPVKNFDKAIEDIDKLGSVVNKEVSASDVTMEFNDISLRVNTAKRVRARMYALLKRVKKVKERVKILREIERLTTLIDSLTTRMNYLRNRASFSTIIITLKAKVTDVVRRYIPSPFSWIAGLDPYKRSLFDNGDDLVYEKPKGFFDMKIEFYKDRTSKFLFLTPDQKNGMRLGLVNNYPPADLKFWGEAFSIDLNNRKYSVLKRGDVKSPGKLTFKRYVIKLSSGAFYIVAFSVSGGKIIVVEAGFLNEKLMKKYSSTFEKFIQSAGLKK